MNEIEAIHARHSVRNYQKKRLEPEKVERLFSLIDELNAEGGLHLELIEDAGKTFERLFSWVMGLASAPSVIACAGREDETLDERIGYYGEKLVLAAQSMGLNTCWAGTFNKSGVPIKLAEGERLVIVIAIGYGADQGKVRRSKTAEQVSSVAGEPPKWFERGVELALLAPTAVNRQGFEIRLCEDGRVEFVNKSGAFGKVDLGIVKYHFTVGAEAAKKEENL